MDLRKLEIFEAVYQTGSVTGGADKLWMAQPSVTLAIKELESELQVGLFDRKPRGMAPTEAAHILHEYASRMIGIQAQAKFALSEWAGLKNGRLRIGASTTIAQYILPKILADFCSIHPGIEVSLVAMNTLEIAHGITNANFDIGFTEGTVIEEGIQADPFLTDRLLFVSQPKIAKSIKKRSSLETMRFISRESGSGTKEIGDQILKELGIKLSQTIEMNSAEAIKQFVASSNSFAILSEWAVREELLNGQLQELEWPKSKVTRNLQMISLENRPPTPAVIEFKKIIQQKFKP